jgi:hypothetical protein
VDGIYIGAGEIVGCGLLMTFSSPQFFPSQDRISWKYRSTSGVVTQLLCRILGGYAAFGNINEDYAVE